DVEQRDEHADTHHGERQDRLHRTLSASCRASTLSASCFVSTLSASCLVSTRATVDRPARSNPSACPSPSSAIRTGTRWTILVKLPVAFCGGMKLNTAPG